MALIKFSTVAGELNEDGTSRAGRASLYLPDGTPVLRNYLGHYLTPMIVRQTSTAAANTSSWALYNQNGTRTILVYGVTLCLFFDGVAVATLMRYELAKATGVTAFSGGVTVTAAQKRTTLGAPVSGITRVLDTGLTLTGATYVALTNAYAHGRVTQTTTAFERSEYRLDFTGLFGSPIEIANQEALVLRNTVVAVVGDTVGGVVDWKEV